MEAYYVDVATASYRDALNRSLQNLRTQEGLPIEVYELDNGTNYLVRCVYANLKKKEQDYLLVRIYNYYFASALAEIILQTWEEAYVKKVLLKEYKMAKKDVEKLLDQFWFRLNSKGGTYLPETRKHLLVKAILEFLDSHNRLNIEGFLNFRANLYKCELKKQIAQAVNDFLLDQEHEEFICLLRKFLLSQRTKYDILHLVIYKNGEVVFYDDSGRNLNKDCLDDEWTQLEMPEDFLIGSILKCAPHSLVIHRQADFYTGTVKIMGEVFEDRVSYCQGCHLCSLTN